MICWGIDNNLTRNISARDPLQITRIKGFVSGITSISLAYVLGIAVKWNLSIFYALLLGAFSYGISLIFFIKALEGLGSFRTGIFFSFAPFIGALTSLILLREWVGWVMLPATVLTVIGVWLISTEMHSHLHFHKKTSHSHLHKHPDIHHFHEHHGVSYEPHIHEHKHEEIQHIHAHWPDTHHRHKH
jgi:hypothetical protein